MKKLGREWPLMDSGASSPDVESCGSKMRDGQATSIGFARGQSSFSYRDPLLASFRLRKGAFHDGYLWADVHHRWLGCS